MMFTSPQPPLLKWPGGKRRLLPALMRFIPPAFSRYYEPFAGGAALFFGLQPRAAILSDINEKLIQMYVAVRDDPARVLKALRRFRNDEESYYHTRDIYRPRDEYTRAAKFLYLQRLAFNGIYRENLHGRFNVPYGHKTNLPSYSADELGSASAALRRAKLIAKDFTETLNEVTANDFVFLDPPYTVSHNNNGFIKYNQHLFSWKQQIQLAALACDLSRSGAHVLVSNAYHMPLLRLYVRDFRVFRYRRFSIIASDASNRREISEAIMISRHTKYTGELEELDEIG